DADRRATLDVRDICGVRNPLRRQEARYENSHLLFDRVAVMLEDRISLSVSGAIGVQLANGQRGCRPGDSHIVVAKIEDVAGRIRDRVVGPGSHAIALAIPEERKTASRVGENGPELR